MSSYGYFLATLRCAVFQETVLPQPRPGIPSTAPFLHCALSIFTISSPQHISDYMDDDSDKLFPEIAKFSQFT